MYNFLTKNHNGIYREREIYYQLNEIFSFNDINTV